MGASRPDLKVDFLLKPPAGDLFIGASQFGDLTLANMRTPTYAPIWNVESNRLDLLGPRTYPDMRVARAIRTAVSMRLFLQPAKLNGLS